MARREPDTWYGIVKLGPYEWGAGYITPKNNLPPLTSIELLKSRTVRDGVVGSWYSMTRGRRPSAKELDDYSTMDLTLRFAGKDKRYCDITVVATYGYSEFATTPPATRRVFSDYAAMPY